MADDAVAQFRPARQYEEFLRRLAEEEGRFLDPETGAVRTELSVPTEACVACCSALRAVPVSGGYAYCSGCGTLSSVPRLRPERLLELLQPDTAADFFHSTVYVAGVEARRRRFAERISSILQYLPSGRVVEVGCAMGLFLEQLLENGFDAVGVEVVPSALELCRARDLPVHAGSFEEVNLPEEGGYDALFCWDVLCHLASPEEFLAKAWRLLKPGGLLFLTTPNSTGIEYDTFWADGKRHHQNLKPHVFLEIFSLQGLRILLERCGYCIITAETPGTMDLENMRELSMKSGIHFASVMLNNLILGDDSRSRAILQQAIAAAGYSSHIFLVAGKSAITLQDDDRAEPGNDL